MDFTPTAIYCQTPDANINEIVVQEKDLKKYTNAVACTKVIPYVDNGVSWPDGEQTAYAQLEKDIAGGRVRRVVVFSQQQLGRNKEEALQRAKWMKEHSVELVLIHNKPW